MDLPQAPFALRYDDGFRGLKVKEEFVRRAGVLRNVHFQQSSGALKALIDWMDEQPPIRAILAAVRRGADGNAIILKGSFHQPPPANTPDEVNAVGLALMEACQTEQFPDICYSRGIGPPYSTSSVQPYVDAGLERFIWPLLIHVEAELNSGEAGHAPEKVVNRLFDEILLDEKFSIRFPKTHQRLRQITAEFEEADTAWQNIGNSCRQAMLEFCQESYAFLEMEAPEEIKRGDVKGLSRHLIQQLYADSRFGDALAALVASIWNYAQPLTHRGDATREEALRIYLWTFLAIAEIAELIESTGR